MPQFRKKPVVIEAMQLDERFETAHQIEAWSGGAAVAIVDASPKLPVPVLAMLIKTKEGEM